MAIGSAPASSVNYRDTDPYCARTFYPRFTRRELVGSDTLLALMNTTASGGLDLDALNVFLRIETFVGTDTAFRDIKADPPDYDWVSSTPSVTLSRSQVIDAYIDLFRQAVRRCSGGSETAVPLSGGQDSRHILLELCAQGRQPNTCWTVDIPWKGSEAEIARTLCGRLDIPHRVFQLPGNVAAIESIKNHVTDFSSLQHAWMAAAVFNGFAKGRILFDGIGGDVLSAGLFLTPRRMMLLEENRIDELVEDIAGPEEHIFGVDNKWLFPRWRALDKVNEEFRKHLSAVDPISSFFFWNRTRRDIGCSTFRLLRYGVRTVHTPYLDPDLTAFLAGLPPSMTGDHALHGDTIARAFPEFADVPYAKPQPPPYAGARSYFRSVAMHSLRYLLAKPCPIIRRRKVLAQLLRSVVSSKHSAEALFLTRRIVYLTELFGSHAPQWVA
jgi:asparagine synthase (glutamine-hydrolysing)